MEKLCKCHVLTPFTGKPTSEKMQKLIADTFAVLGELEKQWEKENGTQAETGIRLKANGKDLTIRKLKER